MITGPSDFNTEKIMKIPEIFKGKVTFKAAEESFSGCLRGAGNNNVMNIHQDIYDQLTLDEIK
jgi:hypothetical protein